MHAAPCLANTVRPTGILGLNTQRSNHTKKSVNGGVHASCPVLQKSLTPSLLRSRTPFAPALSLRLMSQGSHKAAEGGGACVVTNGRPAPALAAAAALQLQPQLQLVVWRFCMPQAEAPALQLQLAV